MSNPEWAPAFSATLEQQLADLGWVSDYITSNTMLLHPTDNDGPEFWLACAFGNDGEIVWAVESEYERSRSRDLPVYDLEDTQAVAVAADRAMQILWREMLTDELTAALAESRRLRALRARIEELAGRLFVTPGALREALDRQVKDAQHD